MGETNNRTKLIALLLELEEQAVLSLVRKRLEKGENPFDILEDAQEAMRQVGERYAKRQYYISSMMMAGEIFREIMEIIEPVLVSKFPGGESGVVLLGTVQGDIHDIGKNIFGTLLRCHGFSVTDLGVDVPPSLFAEEAANLRPHIIALSGLLTVVFDTMKATVDLVRQIPDPVLAKTPVIVGGGMMNAMVCANIGADYWAIDAMTGVQLCTQIMKERR